MAGSALSQLHDLPEAILQCRHLIRCDYAQPTTQAFLCYRSDLVTHRHCRCPSQEIGIRIGGLAFGELDNGTTITVLRLSFSTFT